MPLNNPKFISTLASSITGTSGTNDDDRLKDGTDTLNANLINSLNIASAGSFVASGGNITITAGSTYSAYALTEIKYFRDGKYKTLAAVSAQEPTWAKNTANDWFGLIVIAANDSIAFRGNTALGNTIVDGALPLEGDIPIAAVQISKSLANDATNRKVQFLGMNKLNSEFTAVDNGNVRLTINKGGTLTHRPSSTDYTITLPSATGTLALSGASVNYSQLTGTHPNIDADKITSGTIPDARIASASTWNAKQAALTFGKANTNALKLEEAVATNDILQAGTNQVKGLTYAQLKSALTIGLTDVSGDLDDIADGSNHKKIPNADATKISNLTVSGAIDLDAMKVKSDRLTVTGAIDVDAINTKVAGIAAGATVGATSSQISDIAANTAKTGITSSQASAITANTAKTGITTSQASAITANTAKVGITTTQADAITANSAKVGITSTQASDITAAKTRTDTLTDAYIETKAANKIDALLGADSNAIDTLAQLEDYLLDSSVSGGIIQSLAGKVPTTTTVNGHALSGNIAITAANVGLGNVTDGATVGATTAQANAIAANTAKTGITTSQANAITANTAKTGITTTQADAITANTAKTGITSTQAGHITTNNAKVGITTTQADAITANTSKVGITTSQANAITANTAKTGITSSQASAITANTAKTGISSSQATAITVNTAKPKIFYATTAPTSLAEGDLWHKTDDDNLVYRANAAGVNSIVTSGDGWYVHLSPTSKLKSPVNINGVSFDGSANVTVAAAAGTLTGNTLAAGITSSSLTAVGTIATGTWNATAIAKSKVSTSGTWADGDIAESSITQHEAAISIGNSQLSGATNLGKAILGATNLGNSETKFLKIATDGSGNHTITARTDTQIRGDIGAGTSNLAVGTGSGDALAGNTSIPADLTVSGAGTVHANNYTNTTYSVMDTNNNYAAGLVKAGNATHGNKFLRQDGEWHAPPSESGGITSLAADSTPQLGGDLDANGNKIKAIGSADLIFEKDDGLFLFKDVDSANASVSIGPSSMKFDFQTEGGASGGEAVLQYVDSGGTPRNFITASSDTVAIENRAANGEVHVYGNTSTAGSSGRTLITTFADTAVTTQKKIIVSAQGEGISFADSDESHFVTLKPHATTTSNYDIKLPAAQGGANTILKNDGSGNLSWAADNDTTYANLAALDSTANTKLSGIETNATADQTAAEIRTLVESASDSNVFTDADHSKLNGIEASATADQTAAEIRTLVESASDSNVFTDADHTKLNGIEASATADQTASEITALLDDVASYTLGTTGSGTITIANDLVVTGTTTTNNVETVSTSNGVVFEGAAADGHDMILKSLVADSNKTINLPNAAGTVLLTDGSGASLTALNGSQVTSGTVAAARIAALATSKITSGTFANARISQGSVTQHQGALSITESQISDLGSYITAVRSVTAGGNTLASSETLAFTAGSNVTITESAGAVTIASTDTNTTYSVGDGGLTQNNFTNTLKSKLDNIAASANNYSLPTAASGTLGGVKVGTNLSIDGNGVLSSTNTNQLTTFDIHDGDGTQVTMAHNRELKFVEGAGIDINFTDETPGSNEDPFDLTFKVADNGIGADQLNVSGNGTSGYVLTSDGDGTFSWSAKTTNTNTTYSAGTGITLSSTTFSHTAHTGEVTGSTALTIADDVVDEANLKISNSGSNGQFLSKQSGNTGGLTWATAGDVTLTGSETLTNKSLTSPTLTGTVTATATINVSGNNKLGISDGGAGSPTLRFVDDTDTGIYRPASGQLGFTSNATAQVIFKDGAIEPVTDDDIDLGTSSLKYKNAYFGLVDAENFKVNGGQGSDGQVLTSTGSGVAWEDAAGGASGAQTGITSVLNASLVVGRDADNKISFDTDNEIRFRANGANVFKVVENDIIPFSDNDISLGSSSYRFKNAYFNSGVVVGDGTQPISAGQLTVVQEDSDDYGHTLLLMDNEAGATRGPIMTMYRNTASPAAGDRLGSIRFNGEDGGGSARDYAKIEAKSVAVGAGSHTGQLIFSTTIGASITDVISIDGTTGGAYGGLLYNQTGIKELSNIVSATSTANNGYITLLTIPSTSFSAIKASVHITDSSSNEVQTMDIMCHHHGSGVDYTSYGIIYDGAAAIGEIEVSADGSDNIVIKFKNTQGSTVNLAGSIHAVCHP